MKMSNELGIQNITTPCQSESVVRADSGHKVQSLSLQREVKLKKSQTNQRGQRGISKPSTSQFWHYSWQNLVEV